LVIVVPVKVVFFQVYVMGCAFQLLPEPNFWNIMWDGQRLFVNFSGVLQTVPSQLHFHSQKQDWNIKGISEAIEKVGEPKECF